MAEATATKAPRGATATGGRTAPRRRPAIPPRRAARPVSLPAGYRWLRVLLLAAAVVVGLPLAHAMFGEVAALLGGAALLGFLVGRWTAPHGAA